MNMAFLKTVCISKFKSSLFDPLGPGVRTGGEARISLIKF